jgi:hypothetical protein
MDSKLLTAPNVKTGALKHWTTRLTPALSSVLLPELIRLIGEYCLSRLSWSPVLRSKRTRIVDADADGFGRALHFVLDPPKGERD